MPESSANFVSKPALRTAALTRRAALNAEKRRDAARIVAARAFPVAFSAGIVVAGYAPIRSEFDPAPLMAALVNRGAAAALPAIVARDAPLVFRAHRGGDRLIEGPFGILQPPDDAPVVTPRILLVPLAAFDRTGHRIGYGGGYYDRTIAALRAADTLVTVGLAFAVQEVARIAAGDHDARLDFVITERETIAMRSA